MSQIVENVVMENVVSKSKKFRLAGNKFSLTYPRCGIARDSALSMLKGLSKCPSVIIVAREEHKEESKEGESLYHLHIYLQFEKQFTSSKPTVFDIKEGERVYHPNIQPTKNKLDWIRYITKDDDNYASYGIDVGAYIESATKKKSYFFLSEVVQREEITKEMIQENPKALKGLKSLQNDLQAFKMLPTESQIAREPLTKVDIWGSEYVVMPRVFKQKQLWICGSPNTGKSTMVHNLISAGYKGYEMPVNNDWSGYNDTYDFLYIDEFKGGIQITELNKLLEGSPMRLNTKGGVAFKNKNVPVFILSNYRPENVFVNADDVAMESLLCRLQVITNFSDSIVRSINITTENIENIVSPVKSLDVAGDLCVSKKFESNSENVESKESIESRLNISSTTNNEVMGSNQPYVCVSCRGWKWKGKCLCNSCDVCQYVDCEGCPVADVLPRPRVGRMCR